MDNLHVNHAMINFFVNELPLQDSANLSVGQNGTIKVEDFFRLVSDEAWVKNHQELGLKTIKLIPKECEVEKNQVIKIVQNLGLAHLQKDTIQTSMKEACKRSDLGMIMLLLPFLKPPYIIDDSGNSILHFMTNSEHIEQVLNCLEDTESTIQLKNHTGTTPLHRAATKGDLKTVKLLVSMGAEIEIKNKKGFTALALASWQGQQDVVDWLAQHGANVNVTNNTGETPLHLAARSGKRETVESLINWGAKLDSKNSAGFTPLALATKMGHVDVVDLLALKGANIHAKNKLGETPLHIAARSGLMSVTELLVEKGIKVKIKDKSGNSALALAAKKGHVDVVILLASKGAKISSTNIQGRTPLHLAAYRGKIDVVNALLQLGANIDSRDRNGQTPLAMGAWQGQREVIHQLAQNGADINTTSKKKETPLHLAGYSGHAAAFGDLVKMGGNLHVLTKEGCSPLYLLINNTPASENIEEMIAADNGFTAEIVERVLLAHRFSLAGRSEIAGGGSFELEGLHTKVAVSHLAVAIKVYYANLESALKFETSEMWTDIISTLTPEVQERVKNLGKVEISKILRRTVDAITSSTSQNNLEAFEKHAKGFPIFIALNCPEHLVGTVFFQNRLAICNRGYGCGSTPGIHIYTINNSPALQSSIEQCSQKPSLSYLTKDIKLNLKLVEEVYLAQEYQKVGNCAVANTQSAELALLYMHLEPLLGTKAAEELARAIKRGRTKDTRIGSLENYLNWHRQPRSYPPDLKLIGQIYAKMSSDNKMNFEVKNIIRNWTEDVGIDARKIIFKSSWKH